MKHVLVVTGISIKQDAEGRYCLNDLHRAGGGEKRHAPNEWLRTKQASELIEEISIPGIPGIESKQGIGTFVAKELVYAYAMWISPVFHLKVIRAYDSMVTSPPPIDPMQALNDPTTMRGLLLSYSDKVIALENKNAELAPKAAIADRLVTAEGLFNLTVAAKILQMRRKDLTNRMHSRNFIYRRNGGRWVGYDDKVKLGYLEHKIYIFNDQNGEERSEPQVFVTTKGMRKLAVIFEKKIDLSAPMCDQGPDDAGRGGASHG
jgi:phage antirepressor YoqD-like protein